MNNRGFQWKVEAAPLPRSWLDGVAPLVRWASGGFFLAWSWISTIIILGKLLTPVLPHASLHPAIADKFLVAFVFAAFISIVEFICSDRWPGIYWPVLLICDASFTAYQTHEWLALILKAQTSLTTGIQVAIWFVAVVGGIIAAKFGEVLIFGQSHPVVKE